MHLIKILNSGFSTEKSTVKATIISFCLLFNSSFLLKAQSVSFSERVDKLLFTESFTEAISLLDSVLQKDSLNFEAHYKIALAYQNLYLHDKAISHLNKARSLAGDNIKVLSALGRCYFTLGAYDKAQEQYEAALLKDSANISAAFTLARIFVEQSLYTKAVDIYQRLFIKAPDNSYIMKQLGYCYLKMEDYKSSTIFYELSNINNSSDLNVALQLGVNYILLNQVEHANILIDKYLKIYPSDVRFCRLKGDVLYKQKYYLQADSLYQKVILMGDSSSYVFQKSGFCNYLFALGNDSLNANQKLIYYDRACIAFTNAVEKDSTNPILFMYLGLSLDKSGKFRLGINAMTRAKELSISGLAPDICFYLGNFYKEVKEFKDAVEEYKEALLYSPDKLQLLAYIGDIYSRELKDEVSALLYYEKYLKSGAELNSESRKTIEYRAVESAVKNIKKRLSAQKNDSTQKENTTDRKNSGS